MLSMVKERSHLDDVVLSHLSRIFEQLQYLNLVETLIEVIFRVLDHFEANFILVTVLVLLGRQV